MLTTLRIKNLALVSDLTLELQPGCNAVTGETGAGKSIIIGGLSLMLGERADRTLIRSGEESCSVEAVFDVTQLKLRTRLQLFLDENGLEPCEADQLVLKRTFTGAGANRQFINGSPTTLNILAAIGEWLVDMHGPHDHQSLLHPAKQLAILDAFGGLEKECEAFGDLVRRRHALEDGKSRARRGRKNLRAAIGPVALSGTGNFRRAFAARRRRNSRAGISACQQRGEAVAIESGCAGRLG